MVVSIYGCQVYDFNLLPSHILYKTEIDIENNERNFIDDKRKLEENCLMTDAIKIGRPYIEKVSSSVHKAGVPLCSEIKM